MGATQKATRKQRRKEYPSPGQMGNRGYAGWVSRPQEVRGPEEKGLL